MEETCIKMRTKDELSNFAHWMVVGVRQAGLSETSHLLQHSFLRVWEHELKKGAKKGNSHSITVYYNEAFERASLNTQQVKPWCLQQSDTRWGDSLVSQHSETEASICSSSKFHNRRLKKCCFLVHFHVKLVDFITFRCLINFRTYVCALQVCLTLLTGVVLKRT